MNIAPFVTSSSGLVVSFIASILSLVVGIGGFWITLTQLSRVKDVSLAQEEAIAGLKFRLASFDAIQECAHAQVFLDSIREAIQKSDKPTALVNYDKLALCLINLSESGHVSRDLSDDLKSNADRISVISNGLDKVIINEGVFVQKQLEISRSFHALLMKVRFHIHKEQ